MYTEENMDYNDNYEDNNLKTGFPYKSLLVKIIIIFVCLLLAIWLISKLTSNKKNNNDGTVFNNNIDTIRLASEEYFFIDKNLPTEETPSITLTLKEMNNNDLVKTVYDYNKKVCSTKENESYVTLSKTEVAYEMVIKLTCDSEQKEITYYYDLENGKCLSCNGQTYMDGTLVIDDETEENDDDNEEEVEINCVDWSQWTTKKLTDDNLDVKTRTVFKAYKPNENSNVLYGEWSEYSTTPISPADNLEVEATIKQVNNWSDYKKTTSKITNSDTIKVVNTSTSGGSTTKYCPTGYTRSGSTCYKTVRGSLTAKTYASYKNAGRIVTLHGVSTKKVDGTWTEMYDATYKIYASLKTSTTSGTTTYTYQELEVSDVTYYRSRSITKTTNKDDFINTDYIETLPAGYTKVEGSDITQYAYKYKTCQK